MYLYILGKKIELFNWINFFFFDLFKKGFGFRKDLF